MDAATRSAKRQLAEQYTRATGDSGRFEANDREAFLRHLLTRITNHVDKVTTPARRLTDNDWETFNHQRTTRQGKAASEAFSFVLGDLAKRHGVMGLKEHLTRLGSDSALAISRRICAPATNAGLRLSALRLAKNGDGEMQELHGMSHDGVESARVDVFFDECSAESLRLAIAVDNTAPQRAWASGIELRVQFQTRAGETLSRSGISLFGMLPCIESGKREWLAFSGVDLVKEVQAELEPGDEIYAMRLLITRR